MPTSTLPFLVSADVVYDMIMGDIEPELLTSELPFLPERYRAESAEEHANRMARYKAAYAAFDAEFLKRNLGWEHAFRSYRKEALGEQEAANRNVEQCTVQVLEQSFQ